MKILNFGSCNIDYVYNVDHIVAPGETLSASCVHQYPGGKGLNLSIALARSGVPVYHAGCVGKDDCLLRSILTENGVDTSFLRVVDEQTGHALIQVDKNAENCILIYAGANACLSEEHIDTVLSEFEEGDILFLQNEINGLPYIIEQASKKNLRILLNPSPYRKELKELNLNQMYGLILNELEAVSFSGKQDPMECLTSLHNQYPHLHLVITLGKKGCLYHDGKQIYQQEGLQIHAIDTTAAGDTFSGYFVSGLYRNESPETILKTATIAAGIATTRKGAAPSIPTRSEVESYIKEG